jgi:hypothetical protein
MGVGTLGPSMIKLTPQSILTMGWLRLAGKPHLEQRIS